MLKGIKQLLRLGDGERQKLVENEMLANQDYKMAQSFSGEDIHDLQDAASETTSVSRASSFQKLNGDNLEQESAEQSEKEALNDKSAELKSWSDASFNFINSIIGAGLIGIPFALHQAGFGLGILLIIIIAVFTDYSVVLLIQGGNLANTNTYQGLVKASFGTPGFLVLTAMQFLYPFIAMIGYNVMIGDTVTAVLLRLGGDAIKQTALGSRQLIIVLFNIFIMLPISLYKDVTKISKASMVALVLIVFLLITLIVKAVLLHGRVPATDDAWDFAHSDFLQAIGILSFSYMCHHNSFMLYTSLKNPSQKSWNTVTHLSVFVSMLFILLYGIFGYVIFTGNIQGDVLLNFCSKDDFINVARFTYAMTVVLTYPLECVVTREVVENSIFATKEPQLGRHILITVIIVILTCGISMATDCVAIVLQFNGSLAAIPLAYIFPPLCVLRLQQEPILSLKSIPKLTVAFFGIISSVLGLVMTLMNIAEGHTCPQGDEPTYCLTNETINNSTYSNNTVKLTNLFNQTIT